MVTGPMPRKPNATRPKANTDGATISAARPPLKRYAMPISTAMLMPSQKLEKLPATNPDRMLSDEPPSRDDVTTSLTWRDSVDVKTLTSSGMIAPAAVPQEMMIDSCHHRSVLPPRSGIISLETKKVRTIETAEVMMTRLVRGLSKFISLARL